MDMRVFSLRNATRCQAPNGFNHLIGSWDRSEWFEALVGELGEAANISKKLRRAEQGIKGNNQSVEEYRDKLEREIGDTYIYLDLWAQACGVSLAQAVERAFSSKSREIGYDDPYVNVD